MTEPTRAEVAEQIDDISDHFGSGCCGPAVLAAVVISVVVLSMVVGTGLIVWTLLKWIGGAR